MKLHVHDAVCPAMLVILTVSTGGGSATAWAVSPRSERVAARIAERATARLSIAEARAARAEARVAEIAPLVPVPPPPRPATIRRMARAGVPLAQPGPLAAAAPAIQGPQAAPAAPPAEPARAIVTAAPQPMSTTDPADDGTRSVLTTAEEPEAAATPRGPAGSAVTHPPIELLPTPQP